MDELVAGLDIGTTKVCVLIARIKEKEEFEILGMGTIPSQGITKGVVTDIGKTSGVIEEAIRRAEAQAGLKVKRVWVSIAGRHIQAADNQGFVKVEKEDKVITAKDVEKVLQEASQITLPSDREIIHILPQGFVINGRNEVKEPIGMNGTTLGVKVHIVTASSSSRQDIDTSVKQVQYECEGVTLQCLASAMATLFPEEEDLGVALLDIGGGTTDLGIFLKEGMRFTYVLGVGGNHITNDIAVGFHTSHQVAEKVKIEHGCASRNFIKEGEELEIEGVAQRGKSRVGQDDLFEIIEPRVEEMFELVDKELVKSGYKDLITAGIVLTGGCSLLKGIKEKAEETIGLPTRIGYNHTKEPEELVSPMYATALGLILYGIKRKGELAHKERIEVRIKEWLKDFF